MSSDPDKGVMVEDEWMIRPCQVYEEEYKDCTTIKARFHQYFIYGKTLDCTAWKRDCDNCVRWKDRHDVRSAEELVQSEKRRRKERLDPHYTNDVWQRRTQPPDNWNGPLPDHLKQEYESSYLNFKAKEMRGEKPPVKDFSDYCLIM